METKTHCAHNVSRNGQLSPKVILVDRADQPLTILRLIVEGLGLKSQTSLWLSPLHNAPQLVRPFPFDLAYLDKDLRVICAVELLPEVPFPAMCIEVASALLLPLHTLSATETQEGDRLVVCAEDELEQRLGEISNAASVDAPTGDATSSTADESAGSEPIPVEAAPESTPAPFTSEPILAPLTTHVGPQGVGFTVSLATTWQFVNSTTTAVAPVGIESGETKARLPVDGAGTAPAEPDEAAPTERPESAPAAEIQNERSELTESPGTQEELPFPQAAELAEPLDVSAEIPVDVEIKAPPEVCASASAEAAATTGLVTTTGGSGVEAGTTAAASVQEAVGSAKPQTAETPNRTSVEPLARPAAAVKKHFPQKKKAQRRNLESETSKEQGEPKKDHLGIRVIRWLNLEESPPDRRGKKRYLMPGLVAYDEAAGEGNAYAVRDVGPSGLYLRTPKRWKPGQLVSLTLRSEDAKERTSAAIVKVQARLVRSDREGSVLAFVFPQGVEFDPWKRLHTRKSSESDAEYFVKELRVAKAFGFLRRICEPATEQIRLALHERFSNKRLAGATQIALTAEEMLSRREDARSMIAHPHIVMRILEDGSWADDDWVRQMWAGLLATSCTPDGQDTSNTTFIDLMDKLTPIHLKILGFACRKRSEVAASEESLASLTLYCSGDELVQVAGLNNLARIQQTIGHLANYGLLAESARPSYVGPMEKIKTKATPTALGLQLHARCSGQRV